MHKALKPPTYKYDISVLVSCYYEEKSIDSFYERLSKALESTGKYYEIIFINDGSTDGTFKRLENIYNQDHKITAVVDLFKNVGQGNALTPGIMLANGKAILNMDSDLQLFPEDIPDLIKKYDEGYDLVTGYRRERKDSFFRKVPSFFANMIMRKASRTRLRDFGCTFKIWNSSMLKSFEFGPFNPWRSVPVIAQAGRIAEIPVRHQARMYGKSGQTFRKLFLYNMENLVNISETIFQVLGVVCFFLSLIFLLRVVLDSFFPFSIFPEVTRGLLLNAISVSFLASLSVLAAIGEFVIRNFMMLQKRPAFIVRKLLCRGFSTKKVTLE